MVGGDEMPECSWAGIDELVREYHDHEWGRPVHDDDRLFEMLSLEIFQAGLRWTTARSVPGGVCAV